jgi:hypothetical protein
MSTSLGRIMLIALALSGCARASTSASPLTITMQVTPNPPVVGMTTIDLQVRDLAGQPLTGAMVEVEGSMTHAGMTPDVATATEQAPGHYQATLSLTMSGDWLITVAVHMADGRIVEETLPLPTVQSSMTRIP